MIRLTNPIWFALTALVCRKLPVAWCSALTASASRHACKKLDDQGTYEDCHESSGNGRWPASKTYREVITVYVSTI